MRSQQTQSDKRNRWQLGNKTQTHSEEDGFFIYDLCIFKKRANRVKWLNRTSSGGGSATKMDTLDKISGGGNRTQYILDGIFLLRIFFLTPLLFVPYVNWELKLFIHQLIWLQFTNPIDEDLKRLFLLFDMTSIELFFQQCPSTSFFNTFVGQLFLSLRCLYTAGCRQWPDSWCFQSFQMPR